MMDALLLYVFKNFFASKNLKRWSNEQHLTCGANMFKIDCLVGSEGIAESDN